MREADRADLGGVSRQKFRVFSLGFCAITNCVAYYLSEFGVGSVWIFDENCILDATYFETIKRAFVFAGAAPDLSH